MITRQGPFGFRHFEDCVSRDGEKDEMAITF
jgi:hypothetical protein